MCMVSRCCFWTGCKIAMADKWIVDNSTKRMTLHRQSAVQCSAAAWVQDGLLKWHLPVAWHAYIRGENVPSAEQCRGLRGGRWSCLTAERSGVLLPEFTSANVSTSLTTSCRHRECRSRSKLTLCHAKASGVMTWWTGNEAEHGSFVVLMCCSA